MNSFNHYSYGAIGDWLYRVSAGIEEKKPGYREILIQPHLTKRLDYSKATLESPYGTIASGWERIADRIIVHVTIPANTSATIKLPLADPVKLTENGQPFIAEKGTGEGKDKGDFSVTTGISEEKTIEITRGSGNYTYEFPE